MSLRVSTTCTFGLAVALTLGAASAASAQDTTRTDTTRAARERIPVTKERTSTTSSGIPVQKEPTAARPDTTTRVSGGDVTTTRDTTSMMRTDTTTQQQTDTTSMIRTDTTSTMQQTDTTSMMRTDTAATVTTETQVTTTTTDTTFRGRTSADMIRSGYLFGNSGFSIGVGAGATIPYNQLSRVGYRTGLNISVPISWHPMNSPFGLRVNLAYNQIHADESDDPNALPAFQGSAPDPKVYSGTLDGILKFPFRNAMGEERFAVYANAGGGAYMFRGFGGGTIMADLLGEDVIEENNEDVERNVTKWGINAGGGISFGIGPTSLFLESRWVNVFADGDAGNEYVRWIPIVIGVTFR